MNVVADTSAPMLAVSGIAVEVIERGRGRPLLFLHPGIGIERTAPVLDHLARRARVIAPSHPGFGRSELPRWMTTVDDLAYFYLDFLETLDLRDTIVVGVSIGGWIAAEIAVKSTERLSHLVLANSVGIKVGDRETRDIVDIFAITERRVQRSSPIRIRASASATTRPCRTPTCRSWRATGRQPRGSAWSPFMHNPKLKHRLHRIGIPTLFLWGADDRVLSEPYGRAFCAAIPGARFEPIERAGHFPHLEQPEEFARRVFAFAGKPRKYLAEPCREPLHESLSLHRAALSACLGRSPGLAAGQPAEPQGRSHGSRPTCSTATTTSGCCATSSASTS